jgi:conjugal transfer/entry exclusion protein
VYEQRIEHLSQQNEELKSHEEAMKLMYEKMLSALNSQDKQQHYSLDYERVQELVHQAFRESHPSSLLIQDSDKTKGELTALSAANRLLEEQVEQL